MKHSVGTHPERDEDLLLPDGHPHGLSVLDPGGHRDHDVLAHPDLAGPPALPARVLDVRALPVADPAGGAHHEGPGVHSLGARPVALGAPLRGGAGLGSRAAAGNARVQDGHLQVLVGALGRLGESQVHLVLLNHGGKRKKMWKLCCFNFYTA